MIAMLKYPLRNQGRKTVSTCLKGSNTLCPARLTTALVPLGIPSVLPREGSDKINKKNTINYESSPSVYLISSHVMQYCPGDLGIFQ